MAKAQELFWVRRDDNRWSYGELGPVERGQVFALLGYANDERLTRLGYLEAVPASARTVQCGVCDKWFLDDRFRTAHGDRHHARRLAAEGLEVTAVGAQDPTGRDVGALVDVSGDRESQRLNQEAPLYLEKTTASQKG